MTQSRKFFGRTELFLGVALGLIALAAVLTLKHDGFAEWNVRIFEAWTQWAVQFGYWGAFLSALIGNLTVVIVFPYTLLVFFLATTGLNPFVLGVLTGVGALLGELSGFLIGRIGAGAVERRRPQEYAGLKRIVERRPKLVPILLFVFSLTPMPDDLLFVPLGMLRYSVWKLVIPALIGKVAAGLIIAYTGTTLQTTLGADSVRSALTYQFGTLALLALLFYGIAKVPWHRVFTRLIGSKERPA